MNISQIMGLRLATSINENKQNQQDQNVLHFGLKMSEPIKQDTVSFKGGNVVANRSWNINRTTAKAIRSELKEAERKVAKFLKVNFEDLVATKKYPQNPIVEISHRLKSDISIGDKSGARQLRSAKEIKEQMTDLIGAKIVLREANKYKVDMILDRFIQLIKSGKIELLEIENKRPAIVKGLEGAEAAKYDYGSIEYLRKMIGIQQDVWKKSHKGGKLPKVSQNLEEDFTDANYCAIHFLFKLTGKNSHVFELQMTGNNVNLGKHIDDPIWKKLLGKETDIDSPEFDRIFEPFTNPHFFEAEPNANEIVENARNAMNAYRGEVFIFQRGKEPTPFNSKKRNEIFLPLSRKIFPEEIELKYGISSSDFDYNHLAEVIKSAERKSAKSAPKAKKSV